MERRLHPTTAMILQSSDTITLYPQFLGQDGKDRLNVIVLRILPMALWRTWHTAVDHPHGLETPCYMDNAEIACRAGISQGKIEIDLRELEARGLLLRFVQRRAVVREDGNTYYPSAMVKDFTGLYDLAYEYHEWCHSEEYVPPERAFADFIAADRQLYYKLMRFDNYRRMLCSAKYRKNKNRMRMMTERNLQRGNFS